MKNDPPACAGAQQFTKEKKVQRFFRNQQTTQRNRGLTLQQKTESLEMQKWTIGVCPSS